MAKTQRGKKRKPKLRTDICKPCWELKYCPYGPMVEHFPTDPDDYPLASVRKRYHELLRAFAAGRFRTEEEILDGIDMLEYHFPARWEYVRQFSSQELRCNIFGHICPVFLTWEAATETRTYRRRSRTIPRAVMLKVVRRDAGLCQICSQPVPDNEVQFDHVIPYSRGGPTSVENLRLVHAACNKTRRDSLSDLISDT